MFKVYYSIPSLVRASVLRGPSVVRGFCPKSPSSQIPRTREGLLYVFLNINVISLTRHTCSILYMEHTKNDITMLLLTFSDIFFSFVTFIFTP